MEKKMPGQQSSLKVGELLRQEELASEKDIQRALDIQEKEKEDANLTADQFMLKRKLISLQQLKEIQNHIDYRKAGEADLAYKLDIISKKDFDEIKNRRSMRRSIGEILCDLRVITANDLNYILQKYRKHLKFGEILLRQEYVNETKLNNALREQAHRSDPLGKILVDKKIITNEQLYHALSKQYNIPFKKLKDFIIYDNQVKKLKSIIGYKYAKTNKILPLIYEDNKMTVGFADHEKIPVMHELGHLYTHLKINGIFITEDKFNELFETLYGRTISSARDEKERGAGGDASSLIDINLDDDIADPRDDKTGQLYGATTMEAEEVVNFIIKYGVLNKASDIHIEQNRKKPKIRYRIDGVLQSLQLTWLEDRLQDMVGAIISRIKVISNLDIAERRIPQDGVFRVNYFDRQTEQNFDLDFRVATCPAIIGENVTMRILDSRNADVGLEGLNHSKHVIEPFKKMLRSSAGMLLVSGPTGSGKTSTLYGALKYIYNPGIKIITAEDPIEYSFPDIMQTQVNPKINLTFAKLLRSFLRLDPDVILVGEIRDSETASIGFDAALTGHLLLSTVHTNDSISAITRLLDLGTDFNQIASSLMGVLAQRLVRTTCPVCRKQYEPEKDEWSLLFDSFPEHLMFYRGDGCTECNFSGYKGRTVISELFSINRQIAGALNKGEGEKTIKRLALEEGMMTMIDDGIQKLKDTTLEELIRVVPHEMITEYKSR
jgi:type II secretory ATPase GspE/PulE/Tfp pilus assembly ATPase PilB-like protein